MFALQTSLSNNFLDFTLNMYRLRSLMEQLNKRLIIKFNSFDITLLCYIVNDTEVDSLFVTLTLHKFVNILDCEENDNDVQSYSLKYEIKERYIVSYD